MEFVRGTNLERSLEAGELTMARALKIVDDLFAGLEAMHAVQIAHLDVKPPNLVLRDGSGDAVLVDFGLAGRRIRSGCGSAHYGAAEVWGTEQTSTLEPFATDVYAATAVAHEVLTGSLLFAGDSLQELLAQHFSAQPAKDALSALSRRRELGPLADLFRAALARDARRRPTIARLRAGFAAIERDLRKLQWPLATPPDRSSR
jgi:serine/threonine protein kinase